MARVVTVEELDELCSETRDLWRKVDKLPTSDQSIDDLITEAAEMLDKAAHKLGLASDAQRLVHSRAARATGDTPR